MSLFTPLFWEVCAVLTATAAACALLGGFLVLRRMALLTDAIGHVLLLGIVLGYLIVRDPKSLFLPLAAAAIGLVTVALVEAVSRSKLVKEDAAIGLVFPTLFALGVLLVTLYAKNEHLDVDRVLLGSPELAPLNRLGTTTFDFGPVALVIMAGVFLVNAAFVAVFFKELKLSTFDAPLAAALGFAPAVIHYCLMGLVSLTAVTAFDAAGPVLVVAFFVVPPATAYLLTDRLSHLIGLSVLIGVIGAVGGTVIAYSFGVTIAGTVAVLMGCFFLLALIASPRYGLITRFRRRLRHRRDFFDTMLTIHLLQHEGTSAELEESRVAGLHEHLNWSDADTLRVTARILGRGWAQVRGECLTLTDEGRAAATAAYGFRAVA